MKFELIIGFDDLNYDQSGGLYTFLDSFIRGVLPGHGESYGYGYFNSKRENTLTVSHICLEKDADFTREFFHSMAKGVKKLLNQESIMVTETPVYVSYI